MSKEIKKEILKYFNKNWPAQEAITNERTKQELLELLPKKIKKGIKEITIKKEILYIKTKSPSWRQETSLFKKEIIEKIHKKVRNYTISKIIIL